MFISIPNKKTINEYNDLKKTQRPVKMSETSKRLDEYVYDKYSGLNKVIFISSTAVIDWFALSNLNKVDKSNKVTSILAAGIFTGLLAETLYKIDKDKNKEFSDLQKKVEIYKKHGINAIV